MAPGYAMTIHKAQGRTIPGPLYIDPSGLQKQYGAGYVALSRAPTMATVTILNTVPLSEKLFRHIKVNYPEEVDISPLP